MAPPVLLALPAFEAGFAAPEAGLPVLLLWFPHWGRLLLQCLSWHRRQWMLHQLLQWWCWCGHVGASGCSTSASSGHGISSASCGSSAGVALLPLLVVGILRGSRSSVDGSRFLEGLASRSHCCSLHSSRSTVSAQKRRLHGLPELIHTPSVFQRPELVVDEHLNGFARASTVLSINLDVSRHSAYQT